MRERITIRQYSKGNVWITSTVFENDLISILLDLARKLLLLLEHEFEEKKSQSQNSIQQFEFSRTFFSTGNRAIAARRAEWQVYQSVQKKCGKIQNVVSSSDFEIFSPEIHAQCISICYNEKRTKNVARFARTFLVLRGFSQCKFFRLLPLRIDVNSIKNLSTATALSSYYCSQVIFGRIPASLM